ncbi:hypothetical protein DES52_11717 [Deinococcus yavapaiensis KR-236]|uniref:Uncharacterized protein n=1 Tax=Deinococcus yavapaiensis KR-236 TaxID=694435 RepID=A0A318S3A4_9DEIO|nr:hypothetical protein DES52_11717 [Deinococcus yavapaiensis KR-236]
MHTALWPLQALLAQPKPKIVTPANAPTNDFDSARSA